ncbi:DUF2271 domain-containing protein [Stenotrophomonas sp. HITSZ_GD]|uniref:DUF2271 domain-containing protein n=1 Tax=Stenotrophomonas sp. HITSZ_GD TaxID=3037248 RepID=UPI00240DDE84|nr:DUF2271 domain-containing protein [Stenotrophomonas sp. HITSZ_GD]MDG2525527.1 DUF2271 domain-containing protein [Stenotrophomonas sp. HITSZ_GD]
MRTPLTLAITSFGLVATPAYAATLEVNVEIPKLDVAEYHRPYVAVWIEGADAQVARNLAVWYQLRGTAEGHGTKWLPDLRQWWRKSGRSVQLPIDGVSGPTRPAGTHALSFGEAQLQGLPAGQYTVVVEAAREVGGRELLKVPFQWGGGAQQGKAQGSTELGAVSVAVRP